MTQTEFHDAEEGSENTNTGLTDEEKDELTKSVLKSIKRNKDVYQMLHDL